jgi:hypothetical protein
MMTIVATLMVSALFLGPLVWRIWLDRRHAAADMIGADIRAAINRRLGGESFVAVRVAARSLWRPGRVVLSVPSGHESLVETAWLAVARRVPAGYELVVAATARGGVSSPGDFESHDLARAA